MKAVILSISSDIGEQLGNVLIKKHFEVFGTYMSTRPSINLPEKNLLKLSIKDYNSSKYFDWLKLIGNWDLFISCIGTQSPIGRFEDVSPEKWVESVAINSTYQIASLMKALEFRSKESTPTVLFFAGGGTNSATKSYSAYTIGKISLIKAIELLDHEIKDIKFLILGPGWVKTKIHNETLNEEKMAEENYNKTVEMFKNPEKFNPINKVIDDILKLIELPKNLVSGRNFSSVHDDISPEKLLSLYEIDKDFYKLRRNLNEK